MKYFYNYDAFLFLLVHDNGIIYIYIRKTTYHQILIDESINLNIF